MKLVRTFSVIFIFFGDSMFISSQGLLGAVENILGLDDGPSDSQQYTTAPTARPNINDYPVRNNLQGTNANSFNRDSNRLNNRLQNGLTNPTINLLNQQNPSRVQNSVMQKVNQGNYEDDDVKLAAKQFPALQSFLDRLKEMNRQKELDKQNESKKPNGQSTELSTTTENVKNNESKPKDIKKMNVLRKRKFYFQVEPMGPETERKDKDMESVYYED